MTGHELLNGNPWPEWVQLGDGAQVDPGVILGYLPGRSVADPALVIGPGAVLRAGVVIYAGSRIGQRLETGHNVIIREENHIGDRLSIWNNSTIDYGCSIGDGVKIHCNCYVAQFTVLEDDVFLAPGVTIANDKYPGWEQAPVGFVGPRISRGAQIGVNVTILPGVEIGAGALVGSGSVVTRDVAAGVVVVGNPARVIRSVTDLRAAPGMRSLPRPHPNPLPEGAGTDGPSSRQEGEGRDVPNPVPEGKGTGGAEA